MKGSPFLTGLLVGGASGFAFMFVGGLITIPNMLSAFGISGVGHSTFFTCGMFLLAIGAAFGANRLGKRFAKAKDLAQPSGIGEGIGGMIGGFIGAFVYTIMMLIVITAIKGIP